MTEKYEYYSTVPRTFVHDCRCLVFPLSQESKRVGDREVGKKGGALPPPSAFPCPFLRLPRRLPLLKIPILELLGVSQVNRLR